MFLSSPVFERFKEKKHRTVKKVLVEIVEIPADVGKHALHNKKYDQ